MTTDTKTIPNGWRETTLGEVADKMFSGGTPLTTREDFYGGEIPWLRTQEVNFNYINDTDIKITEAGLKNSAAKWTPENTVVIAMYGNSAGRSAFSKIKMTTNQACCNFVADPAKADPLFVYFNLKGRYQEIEGMANGAAQQNLSVGGLKELKMIMPSVPEQCAISAVLSSLDDKIELLREENKTLEAIAQAMFKEWFVNFNFSNADGKPYKTSGGKMVDSELGEIPEGWRVGRFTDISSILGGGTPKTDVPKYWNGDIPFFTPKDARDDVYCLETEKTITKEGFENCNSRMYPKNTVFITARGTVGKCALASRDMAMNQSCYALVGKDVSNLFVYLATKDLLETFLKRATGAVFDAITTETFTSLEMVIPPEQKVKDFTEIIEPIFNKILSNSLSVQTLSASRDALLPKLMKGEIRVKI